MILRLLVILIFLVFSKLHAFENRILFKINNEIVTTVDVSEEINYLSAVNKKINELDKNTVISIAKNSIIKENLKKIELKKNFQIINLNEKELNLFLENIYKNIGINNLNDFKKYLDEKNIDFKRIEEKIKIERSWNQMIYNRYVDQIKIDKESIENELRNKKIKSYLISEIVFRAKDKEELKKKFNKIKKTIIEKDFETAAIIHSVSDSSQNGGNIGWIKENSFSNIILKNISKISPNEFTDPISIPGGFIIIKVNNLKNEKAIIDLEEETSRTINVKINNQLSQFSNIYLNKIRKDIFINE